MKNNHDILAIIPARGGSKRLPDKNILDFAGKPLIAWTIAAALKSKYITNVIVSTDDAKIASIAKKYGAKVPFLRPESLASDESTTIDVVLDLINKLSEKYEYITLLQPTSPLRTAQHIDEAFEQLRDKDAVVSLVKTEHPIEWCNTLSSNKNLDNFINGAVRNKRSQDLPEWYRINGAIYIVKTDVFLHEKAFLLEKGAVAYLMDREVSIDIDQKQDFIIALMNFFGLDEAIDKLNK
ncbi:acylneuraminate cytidylyltransferase family protein [Amylibacter sp.]|nr:acylneuraminate cytidylyltransferase family protein [Amylibacter sp.]